MTDTVAATGLRDYVAWHQAYDDPNSDLSKRLRRVQGAISRWLDETRGGVSVLSVCAGQGHDIIGVLAERVGDRTRVTGTLVELNPQNARVARQRIERMRLYLHVLEADAGRSNTYRNLPKADLLLLSGIMGNISADDIHRLIASAPQLCRRGATVIWTRGEQEPDLGPEILQWFEEAGFRHVHLEEHIDGTRMRMGIEQFDGEPTELEPDVQLFTFIR